MRVKMDVFLIIVAALCLTPTTHQLPIGRYNDAVPPSGPSWPVQQLSPNVFQARPPPPPLDPLVPLHVDPNNPYLETLGDPFYPSYGIGVGYQKPTVMGGAMNIPTGNVFQPSMPLNGTLGITKLHNVRLGTQLGPAYPWQDPRFAGSAKYLALLKYQQQQQQAQMADAIAQQHAARNSGPTDPFSGQQAARGPQAFQPQQQAPFALATPPPLPVRSRFRQVR